MYVYKLFFRSGGLEYCGGKNRANSTEWKLWANQRKPFKEFAYNIGIYNERQGELVPSKDFHKLPKKDVENLISFVVNS